MKTNLWNEKKCGVWDETLKQYEGLILAHNVNQLPEIDAWYQKELPALISKREPACVTKDEFLEILRWKMKRGDWREYNRIRIAETDALLIKKTAQRALAAARAVSTEVETKSKEYKEPIQIVCELNGVGPATASALLAAYRPDLYPFFDEWIGKQIEGLEKVAFTASYYWKYADALRTKARELQKKCGDAWHAQNVGQALWVASGGKLK